MKIMIYEEHGLLPIEVWKDYPFVPNVGDMVSTSTSGSKSVVRRVFEKNVVCIRIK
jgi:hypothetical protein